ncbi:MAG: hypothetical protein ACRET0_15975, partial [Steroidobacteraceae bacterium]
PEASGPALSADVLPGTVVLGFVPQCQSRCKDSVTSEAMRPRAIAAACVTHWVGTDTAPMCYLLHQLQQHPSALPPAPPGLPAYPPGITEKKPSSARRNVSP